MADANIDDFDIPNAAQSVYEALGSWRKVARRLGHSSRYWWRVARGDLVPKWQEENRLREYLGLPLRPPVHPATSCIDCWHQRHEVMNHADGLRCFGLPGEAKMVAPHEAVIDTTRQRAVSLNGHRRRRVRPAEWARANEARKRRGLAWRDVWKLVAEKLEEEA